MSETPDFTKSTILIADDAYFMRHMIKKSLAPLKFGTIFEAETGKELLEIYGRSKVDLVIMDIIMNEMNGLETLARLKEEYPDAMTIIVSAVDVPDILNECIELGIEDFIVKPFKGEELCEAVRNSLNPERTS